MINQYLDFINSKVRAQVPTGHVPFELNKNLFDFQRAIVDWALRKGRAAIFADTGLGKSLMQLSWCDDVAKQTLQPVLIVAPLAVSEQTISEGNRFGIQVTRLDNQNPVLDKGIYITNYERLHLVDFSKLSGIALDESSILKSQGGRIKKFIIDSCQQVPYRLSCTATPSPNDFVELGNQCEFLGVMSSNEMLATYFVNDTGDTGTWRLKKWGKYKFWEWMASWAVVIRNPSDLGFDGSSYDLPAVKYFESIVDAPFEQEGQLFAGATLNLSDRRKAQRGSLEERCKAVADLVNSSPNEPWLIWCNLNDEADLIQSMIDGSVNVQGSDTPEFKTKSMMDFSNGELRVLISKGKIAGFGMNWQHCARMAFVGLDDSFEKFYQSVRRCYRFGQTREVEVHIFTSESEGQILQNLKRKEAQHHELSIKMVDQMKEIMNKEITGSVKVADTYKTDIYEGDGFKVYLGDCVEVAKNIESESIDFSIFSPPFVDLFTYSNSEFDMGNCRNSDEFNIQFQFLIAELFRVMKPGRNVAFHCMNLPSSKMRDGFIGLKDFRGDLIRVFQKEGFIFHSEVAIWKDPVVAMQRTKALGLLHKTIKSNATMSRMGIPDYLVTMRKPGDAAERVVHGDDLPVSLWQKYASPVWDDIDQSRTLNKLPARDENDEKHMCPLQLDVIERAIHLWTNSNDLVFSPFTGIGSEGYCSVRMGRRFVGAELKPQYYDLACKNIEEAKHNQLDLFAIIEAA